MQHGGEQMCSVFCFIDRKLFIGLSVCVQPCQCVDFTLQRLIHGHAHRLTVSTWMCANEGVCARVWYLTRVRWEAWQAVLVGNPTPHSHTSLRWRTAWLPSFFQSCADAAVNEGCDWLGMWQTQTWWSMGNSRGKEKKKSKLMKRCWFIQYSQTWPHHELGKL